MERLRLACTEKGPLCVGLDTDPSYLPPEVLRLYPSAPDAVLDYNRRLIEAVKGNAACCKVQIAYYEAMGLQGLRVYAETLKLVRDAGMPVIADIKRGDIADTAKAYARAHFSGELEADIITVNPYMGFDTLEPFLEYTASHGKGFFVLLRTSNPGMKDIEWKELKEGGRVLDRVASEVNSIAARFPESGGCSPVGAVVGCTDEEEARRLRDECPNVFFLIPGYGAQGGAARIAATLLDRAGGTVNSSRAILTAWKKEPALEHKKNAGELTMDDLAEAAGHAAFIARAELTGAAKSLSEGILK
jgi:orotidine-5'-phosphate decarboxylase